MSFVNAIVCNLKELIKDVIGGNKEGVGRSRSFKDFPDRLGAEASKTHHILVVVELSLNTQ